MGWLPLGQVRPNVEGQVNKNTQLLGPLPTVKSLACNIFLRTGLNTVNDDRLHDCRRKKNIKNLKPNIQLRLKKFEKCSLKSYQMFHTDHFQISHCLNKSSDRTENLKKDLLTYLKNYSS